jgi:hypothetical protein
MCTADGNINENSKTQARVSRTSKPKSGRSSPVERSVHGGSGKIFKQRQKPRHVIQMSGVYQHRLLEIEEQTPADSKSNCENYTVELADQRILTESVSDAAARFQKDTGQVRH